MLDITIHTRNLIKQSKNLYEQINANKLHGYLENLLIINQTEKKMCTRTFVDRAERKMDPFTGMKVRER